MREKTPTAEFCDYCGTRLLVDESTDYSCPEGGFVSTCDGCDDCIPSGLFGRGTRRRAISTTIESFPIEVKVISEIDHDFTDEIVCPYCGYAHGDSWEFKSNAQDDLGLYACCNCEKEFYVNRAVSVTYSTEKATYGECKHCHKTDIVIESKTGYPYPKYDDLCPDCGQKEEHRQQIEYCNELQNISDIRCKEVLENSKYKDQYPIFSEQKKML